MKCPYQVMESQQIQQSEFRYDGEGLLEFTQTITKDVAELRDCIKEECAVWIDGRCTYGE